METLRFADLAGMITLLRKNSFFFIPFFIFLFGALILIFSFPREEIFYFINKKHHPIADWFFTYYTYIGDGIFYSVILLLLLFFSYRQFLVTAICFLFSALLTQGLKHFFALPRPGKYFMDATDIYFIPGLEMHINHSFPSGHTTSAFTLFTLLSLMAKKKWTGFVYFFLALTAGFSRMYLAQHFIEDVLAGALLGTFLSVLVFWWLNKESNLVNRYTWIDHALWRRKNK